MTEKLPYYKHSLLSYDLIGCPASKGCTPVDLLSVTMDKAPPLLRDQPPEVQAAAQSAGKQKIKVEPFDIQDIPDIMKSMKVGMPIAAKLMRKWFEGKLNFATNAEGDINQDGKPFPSDMVDKETIKLDWVLSHKRAKEKYDELIATSIRNSKASEELVKILRLPKNMPYVKGERYPNTSFMLYPMKISNGDIQNLHKEYQFQRIEVDTGFFDRGKRVFSSLDDLFGALAGFNIYAAITEAHYYRESLTVATVTITEIAVYVKDSYTFYDKVEEKGKNDKESQYLGHWGHGGVRVVLFSNNKNTDKHSDRLNSFCEKAVFVGEPTKNCTFYPIFNNDFRSWQMKHKQGGDMVLYSDVRIVKLKEPIVLEITL